MCVMSLFSFFSYMYITFLVSFCIAEQVETFNKNDTSNRLLPAYAIASRADLLNLTTCRKELRAFQDAVDHRTLWGLRMLDSSGGPKPGFLYGNNYWLGSRSQCHDTMNRDPLILVEHEMLNNTLYRDPREEFPPFKVNYFIARFRHNSTVQYHVTLFDKLNDLITLGLCLPASCSTNDLNFILEGIFRDRVLLIGDIYSADFRLVKVKDLRDDHQWLFSGPILFIGFVLVFIWILMIVGTIYDVFVYQKYLKARNVHLHSKNQAFSQDVVNCDESDLKNVPKNVKLMSLCKNSKIKQVLICFSIYTNTRMIFNTKSSVNSISAIYGLKFLSMVWIIIGHTIFFKADYVDNFPWGWKLLNQFTGQLITSAIFSVDTYFFLSGFLLTYGYLRKATSKMQPKSISFTVQLNDFFLIILKRFVRLTPAYMIMIAIVYLNSSWYSRTSEFYMNEKSHETCAKYWWRNLLYINNLFDSSEMCLLWSWYLACDTQFFIITWTLLILSSMYFYPVAVVLCIFLIGSTLLSGYISYVNEFVPTLDEWYRSIDVLYYPPWLRIGPYIIGIITAYIIIKINKKLAIKRRTLILCWCLSIVCNITVMFGLYERRISVLATAFYVALSKTAWAIGLAWLLLACYTNHGGIVNKLLSFKCWIPLSKLTYCAYLVNPFIINSIDLHGELTTHLDYLHMSITCFGIVVVTFFTAYVFSLMSEMPFILLMENFSQRGDIRKRDTRNDNICYDQSNSNDDIAIE